VWTDKSVSLFELGRVTSVTVNRFFLQTIEMIANMLYSSVSKLKTMASIDMLAIRIYSYYQP
jgi:hypothetical protein